MIKSQPPRKIGLVVIFCLIFGFIYINQQAIFINLWPYDSWFFDKFVKLSESKEQSKESTSILIDTPSLSETGFPIDRSSYANLLKKLNLRNQQGPVIFDIIFGDSTQYSSTLILNSELKKTSFPVTLAGSLASEWNPPLEVWNRRGFHQFKNKNFSIDGPFPPILNTIKDIGISDFFPDEDGVLRWYPLVHKVGGFWVPSLALSAWIQSLGARWVVHEHEGRVVSIQINDSLIDLTTDPLGLGRILVVPKSKSSALESKSFLDQDTIEFSNKVIFVGVNIPGISSFQNTAMDIQQVSVHIHQVVFEALAHKQLVHIDKSFWLWMVSFWLIFSLLTVFRILSFEFLFLLIANFVLFIITISVSFVAFRQGIFLSPFAIFPLFVLNIVFIYYQKLSKSEREREFIRTSFSHYLAPELVDNLIKKNKLPELKGESRDIAIMFVDLRNFTSLSENLHAEILVTAMNEFFEMVSRNVIVNGGTIDKFIGDSVMAFWNAPGETVDFQKKAILAAKGIISDFEVLCKKWQVEFLLAEDPKLGIGIHSGCCIVGNVGGQGRFNYTALGDNVNLASRIEGLCKVYGVHLLVSEDVVNGCEELSGDLFLLDEVCVKGKVVGVKLYTMKSDFGLQVVSDWQDFLELYREGSIENMRAKLSSFEDLPWKTEFLSRLPVILVTRQEKWDGIWKFERK